MALTEKQTKALRAKLNHRHVKTREIHGSTIAYVEGWHVIAEANRIFGFENWDRQTQSPECLWSETQRGQTVCFYSTKVRITVRTGETLTIREGIGTGLGRSAQADVAHEMAVKAAETDATKRALATFGNPFGLALYDRDLTQVTKPRDKRSSPPARYVLILTDERTREVDGVEALVTATREEVQTLATLDAVYAFWTRNLLTFTGVGRTQGVEAAERLAIVLKDRLRAIGGTPSKSALLLPKETRIRDRDHLAFVARQPCLVCGRRPAQAHHLKFAQPRAMSMKVSDEYTVPLCNGHHDALHRTGDERAWWARHGIIEPLKFAARLWAASRNGDRESYQALPDAPVERPPPSEPQPGPNGGASRPHVE